MILGVVVSLNIHHSTTTNICYVITLQLWYNRHKWQGVTMKDYFLSRLKEPSTWRSAIWVATSFGLIALQGEQKEAIIALGMALSGAVGIATPDKLH
jgi:hypothetical protein